MHHGASAAKAGFAYSNRLHHGAALRLAILEIPVGLPNEIFLEIFLEL